MRRFHILAHFLGQFREKLPNYIVRRESIRVLRLEVIRVDIILGVSFKVVCVLTGNLLAGYFSKIHELN
jgi:hypothetical protein